MTNSSVFLEGYSDLEKGAYLGAIASLATADRKASEEEIAHLNELSDAAGLSEEQKQYVTRAANELSGEGLNECLEVLKKSDLKYSLVTDLIAFAKSDSDYSEEEQHIVSDMGKHLGVSKEQFSLLDQFAGQSGLSGENDSSLETPANFSSSGLKEKLQNSGINTSSLFKGILAIAGPLLLSRMMGRRSGMGGMMGGGMMGGGGLGSLIGMLGGGGGFGRTGGLLGRTLGGGRW